jgi:hypothetical protein
MNDRVRDARMDAALDAFYEAAGGRYNPDPRDPRDVNFSLMTQFSNELSMRVNDGMSVHDASAAAIREMFPNGYRGKPNDGLDMTDFDNIYHRTLAHRGIPDDGHGRGGR